LAGGAFLRLGNLCPEAVQTQKSPSGQLPEDRRPEGLGNEKLSSLMSVCSKKILIKRADLTLKLSDGEWKTFIWLRMLSGSDFNLIWKDFFEKKNF